MTTKPKNFFNNRFSIAQLYILPECVPYLYNEYVTYIMHPVLYVIEDVCFILLFFCLIT